MAPYTIVNLKEVEDQAPKFGHSPNLEARFAGGPLQLRNAGISYQRLAPNFRLPFGHRHRQQEEVYVLVAGSARLKVGDEVLDVKQWDAVRVPSDQVRCFEAGAEGAEIIAFGAPNTGPAGEDAQMIPNWWAE